MIADFEYFAPRKLDDALVLLDKYQDDCKIIAGGQSMLVLMRQGLVAPRYLIDIKGISDLKYIRFEESDGLKIGALTTHREIERSPLMKNGYSVLSEMEKRLASIQTRNWGTIGGNLCHGDPAGDPVPVLIALKATVVIASTNGENSLPIEDFYSDYLETVLQPYELLTEVQIPPVADNTGTAYTKFNVIESDMGTVGVAVSITLDSKEGICSDLRIALGAAAPTPMRARGAEEILRGKKITKSLLAKAGETASAETDPISDISASEEYRRDLVRILVARVGREAMARAAHA